MQKQTDIIGLVYAGGQGARLGGVCKAQLRVNGKSLLERAGAELRPHVSQLLVSTGHWNQQRFVISGAELVEDWVGLAGPLAGLAAATQWALKAGHKTALLLTLPVDQPALPENFLRAAPSALSGKAVAMASVLDHPNPAIALWSISQLNQRLAALNVGTHTPGLKDLFAADETALVPCDDYAQPNINCIADLLLDQT